jgi:hypothetical protein
MQGVGFGHLYDELECFYVRQGVQRDIAPEFSMGPGDGLECQNTSFRPYVPRRHDGDHTQVGTDVDKARAAWQAPDEHGQNAEVALKCLAARSIVEVRGRDRSSW